MASVNFYTSEDMVFYRPWSGYFVQTSSTQFTISNGINTGTVYGQFVYANGIVYGTLTGLTEWRSGGCH
jgi:hypothetical protein